MIKKPYVACACGVFTFNAGGKCTGCLNRAVGKPIINNPILPRRRSAPVRAEPVAVRRGVVMRRWLPSSITTRQLAYDGN